MVCRGLLGKEDTGEMGRTVPTKQMKITETAEERQWTDRGIAEYWRKVIPPAAMTLALCPKLGSIFCQIGAEPWISGDRDALYTAWNSSRKKHAFLSAPMCEKGLCLPPFHHLFFLGLLGSACPQNINYICRFSFWPFCVDVASSLLTCVDVFCRYSGPISPDGCICHTLRGCPASHLWLLWWTPAIC